MRQFGSFWTSKRGVWDFSDKLLEQDHLIYQALDTMSPRCQELLTALFLTEPAPSYEEITEQFNIPIGSIGPYRSRCLKKLRLAFVQIEQ